jgi:hypothetical protein
VVAENLTRQPDADVSLRRERGLLGLCALRRLATDELHTARRATRTAAARMQLVDPGILLERQDESFVVRDYESPDAFNGQIWQEHSSGNSELRTSNPEP